MEITRHFDEKEDKWIFSPAGDIDIHSSEEFKSKVLEMYKKDKKDIIIDGKDLDYVDSTGLGALIYIYKELEGNENNIILDNLKPNILKVINITALDKVFTIRGAN